MKLEFILCEISEESVLQKRIIKNNKPNEFIIVGEEVVGNKEYYKVIQLDKDGIRLLGGLKIDEAAYSIEKNHVRAKKDDMPGTLYTEIDIPKEYLTVEIIETIERLNE